MALKNSDDGPGVRFPPPLLYIASLAIGIALSAWHPLLRLLPPVLAWTLGGVVLAAGVVLGPLWGIRVLLTAGTTVRPDRAATRLVTDGPYRFSRNPLYLALTLMYAGIALIANSIWALLLLVPLTAFMTWFVIGREEAHLLRAFGEEYQQYKMRVRRWL